MSLRNLIFKSFYIIGYIFHYICPQVLLRILSAIINRVYTGFISNRFAYIGNSLFQWRALSLCGCEYMKIGDKNTFEKNIQLSARKVGSINPKLLIGNGCLVRSGSHITTINSIIIGNGLLTGNNVLISDNSHGDITLETLMIPPRERLVTSKGGVTIGNNVWLGNNVCVLSGVIIGDGVIVGSNSVVTHNIPSYSVAVGIPAKVIKKLK